MRRADFACRLFLRLDRCRDGHSSSSAWCLMRITIFARDIADAAVSFCVVLFNLDEQSVGG